MASADPDLNDPDPSPEQRDPEPAEGQGLVTVRAVDPQRLLRIAGVTREVLEEARRIRPEEGAVEHLRQVHGRIYHELKEALPPELYEELDDLTPDLRDGTLAELAPNIAAYRAAYTAASAVVRASWVVTAYLSAG